MLRPVRLLQNRGGRCEEALIFWMFEPRYLGCYQVLKMAHEWIDFHGSSPQHSALTHEPLRRLRGHDAVKARIDGHKWRCVRRTAIRPNALSRFHST